MARKNRKRPEDVAEADDAYEQDAAPKEEKREAKKADGEDLKELHAEALKQYERGYNKDRANMERAYEDLKFAAHKEAQWDPVALKDRGDRPALTVDMTGQFIRQVTGDMRQMRPAIKCVAADERAETEVADKVLPGMIRYVENRSDAQGAYFSAGDSQVIGGIGHWRVMTEYADSDTFNQEIRIAPIEDGVAVVWDPDSILPTREDAMFCFVPVDMSRAAFEEKYPDASADALLQPTASCFVGWFTDDHVRITEYWYKKPAKRMLALMPNGGIDDLTDADPEDIAEAKQAGARIESRDGFKVCRGLMTASDFVEDPTDWPGRHIPIVPLLGEEIKIGREIVRRGVVRVLRDPCMLYNYAISTQAEVVALQPKAPFIGTQKQFQDHEDEWETANSKNWPYLEYTPDPMAPGPPQRATPPLASKGLAELLAVAQSDMSAVTGIYPASLGAASNETSGKAILARQREGDTGTIVYKDNFGRSLRRTGQIVLDLIPHVYDTERMITIIGEDGKHELVKINQAALSPMDGLTEITLRDVTIGAYHLVMEMGPSYATRREEARDGMQSMMQALGPETVPLVADLFAKQQDWPLADQIAERFEAILPPAIKAAIAEKNGEPPAPMPGPPPPTPEQQMAVEKHQADIAQNQGKLQLDAGRLQFDQQKHSDDLQVRLREVDAEIEKARLDHSAKMAGHQASVVSAQAGAPQPDPRVDELAQAVVQLRDMVVQIAQAVSSQQPPDNAPADFGGGSPMSPPPGPMPMPPNAMQAPPGAVPMPGAMPTQGA